jgi:hypothetical protein
MRIERRLGIVRHTRQHNNGCCSKERAPIDRHRGPSHPWPGSSGPAKKGGNHAFLTPITGPAGERLQKKRLVPS